jgi:hypothetical protein
LADDDLLAVGDLAGEVEGGEVDAGEWAAGEGEYVGDAGAGRSMDQAGAAYFAGDVYDHHVCRLARDAG